MKESLYTIPIIDAFIENKCCPFCNMYEKLELEYISYLLGPAYMEDDIRAETNRKGFCKKHFEQLYNDGNRLGMSLIVQTHLQEINKNLEKFLTKPISVQKKQLFIKKNNTVMSEITTYLNNITSSCYICDKINTQFNRYVDTFFMLYKKDESFNQHLKTCQGFCLPHFSLLLQIGQEKLKTNEFESFYETIVPIQLENMNLLEEQLDWFVKKFDYRYKDDPWKNSKDALPDSIYRLSAKKIKDK